jgi:hypothetical protein
MERFVIGAAIFAAVVIAAGGYFGHAISDGDGSFEFRISDDEAEDGDAKGTGAPSALPAKAYVGAAQLKIRNAVAVLTVIPEDRADIAIEIANPGLLATPEVRSNGDEVIVDGGVSGRRVHNCKGAGENFSAEVRGVGAVEASQAPQITARVPRDVHVHTSGAVFTDIGAARSVELSLAGCGDVKIADVTGLLDIASVGSGDVIAGASGSADVSVAGSGDVSIGAVVQKLDAAVAGSGNLAVASARGDVDVAIAGSGSASIAGGIMGDADVSIAGSGGVSLGGDVKKLDVSIAGSGDVDVKGKADSVEANIMGSGDVTVGAVSGTVERAVVGSGRVIVGATSPVPASRAVPALPAPPPTPAAPK